MAFMSNYYTDARGLSSRKIPAANPVAQWEEARKKDFGFELGFLKNDLTINVDFFDEKRTHMLLTPRIPMMVGNTFKDQNLGSMKKHGFDLELNYRKSMWQRIQLFYERYFRI